MVTDARSAYLNTTNNYLKYQIIVDEVAVDTENNTSTINIRVEAWRTDSNVTDLEGYCTVKVDGDPGVGAQGWDRGEKEIGYYTDTEVYNISEEAALVVPHKSDGTKKIYVEASCTWWYSQDDMAFDSQMSDSEGLSVYSILRRIKIPGVVVSSALDGTVNALMTLRIGYITRTYLQQGEQALTGIRNKRAVKLQAMKDSLVAIPSVVASGSTVVGKKTSNFIIKLIGRDYSKNK